MGLLKKRETPRQRARPKGESAVTRGKAAWDIHFEAGGSLAPPLAQSHGVTRAEVQAELRRCREVLPKLQGTQAPSGFVRVLKRTAPLRALEASAARWRARKPRDLIHIGIGGSSLGAEALLRATVHPHHALQTDRARGGPRVHFIDNVDPETLGALFDVVDLRQSLVHVVSKSGSTVETAAGFQIVREALERAGRGVRWAEHCVFTAGRGALRDLGTREGVEILEFPEDIGGRFSILTPSGLFTPAVAGVNVGEVVQGARRYLSRIANAALADNSAAVSAAIAYLMTEKKRKNIHVLMPYADALEPLARWYAQLVGESLGKRAKRGARTKGVGPTPLPARGTTDQHSQVQLFVEGPTDKWVNFVTVDKTRSRQQIPGGDPAAYLDGIELGSLMRAEQRGTAVALAAARRPSAAWSLPEIHPQSIGQLFFALELQTAYQGKLYGIDTYDQPGVEAGKVAAFALIGRDGYQKEKSAIEANTPPIWRI
jgi:glucose-6-phosphate isomerase